LAFSIILIIK
jgi:beta-1,4-mannosyltransferase